MIVGVISDTHGDVRSWRKAVEEFFKDAALIIHAGDVLYHGPRNPLTPGYNPPALSALINSCPAPVLFARGNCDAEVDQLMLDYPIQSPYAFLQVGSIRIMAHHGDGMDRDEALRLSRLYRADLFISGHTHVPSLEEESGVILLNPGSPSLPKGDGRPAVAVLECGGDSIAVKIIYLDDGSSGEVFRKARG
ncbi:MAG: phosphodiesterase [Eubacteriales bacterium]